MLGQKTRSRIMRERWEGGLCATNTYRKMLKAMISPGMDILHAGCGWDRNNVTRPYRDDCHVVGVDLDPRLSEMYHSEFHLAPLSSMPFENESFDIVVSEYVFEHIDDPLETFREVARVLKPGGQILILTPNFYSYKTLAAYLTPDAFHHFMGGIRYGKGHEADMYPTVYKCNTSRSLKYLSSVNGLEVQELRFETNGPTWFEKMPVVFGVSHLFHLVIRRLDAAKILRCAIIFRVKKT